MRFFGKSFWWICWRRTTLCTIYGVVRPETTTAADRSAESFSTPPVHGDGGAQIRVSLGNTRGCALPKTGKRATGRVHYSPSPHLMPGSRFSSKNTVVNTSFMIIY